MFFISVIPFLILLGLFFISQNSRSYDDKTTHPALTDEIVDFYNLSFDDKLTSEEKEWIVQGSIDEDTPPRWINHFYDPIYKVGWLGENTGIWPAIAIQYFSQGALSSEKPVSLLNWLHNQNLQAKYGAYYGNRTWERAIYEAVKNGDKKEAYYTLGYILHLVEDATVPDHTRNDTHAHELEKVTGDYGSPYEEFSKQSKRENLNIAKELKQRSEKPISKSSIDEYLISLSEYSNKYFFSKDTINNTKYIEPDIKQLREGNGYGYSKDENEKEFEIVKITKIKINDYKIETIYSLFEDSGKEVIMPNYFSRLSRQAVLSGAGVINLFKQEVMRAEKDKLKDLPKESASIWSITGRYFQIKNALASVYQTITNTLSGILTPPSPEMLVAQLSNVSGNAGVSSPPSPAQIPSVPVSLPQSTSTNPIVVSAPTNQINSASSMQLSAPFSLSATNLETELPSSVAVSSATTTITAATATTTTTTTATTTISTVLLYQGGGYVSGVSPADALLTANATAQEQQQVSFPEILDATTTDTMPPVISSVNATGTTATSTIILWKTDEPADSQVGYGTTTAYDISSALNSATTTTHQVALSGLSASTTYHYIVKSRDAAGNFATSTDGEFTTLILPSEATSTEEIIVATTTSPTLPDILPGYHPTSIVINEVAWMGTQAQANDEWIELYNKTSQPIDLAGWSLENGNQSLKINLKGVIQPRSYYLLERTASTTTNQEEDMVYAGAMPNSGQVANLYLKNASSSIIDHIHRWYAGDNNSKNTMERVSPYVRGETQYNWSSYASGTSTPPFAKDADGNDIFGTPKAKNSASIHTPIFERISQSIIWYKELSPYFVYENTRIEQDATLTIQPGVTVKFSQGAPYGGGLEILGVLLAEGTQDDYIIFTSASTDPKPGYWQKIIFSNPNQQSILKYTLVKYGGQGINRNPNGWYPTYTGAINIINSDPEISNSTFDQNQAIAVYIAGNSNPKITGNIIKNTDSYTYRNGSVKGFGIQLADGGATAEISGNTIERNSIGIKSASASTTPLIIKDNIFANNGVNGEFRTNTFLNLDNLGNQDQNKQSGFYLIADFHSDRTSTIKKDTMPYIISDILIRASSTIVIEPGTVLKNSGGYYGISKWLVQGALKAKGTQEHQIIFTSAGDSVDGYNSGSEPSPGDWNRLYFEGGNASQSEIDYAVFRYGDKKYNACPWAVLGGPCWKYDGVVLIENSSPTITNSTFGFNNQPDIKIKGVSSPILENNTLDQIVTE
ncbi:MAG: lamin tail domain-containing protein [Patescibacteria group bacterium]